MLWLPPRPPHMCAHALAASQAGRAVVEAVEKLDGQLKRREGLESVKPQLELLRGQLDGMATLLADTAPQ